MLKAGYFINNPAEDVLSKEKKNKRRKTNLEAEDYIKLLKNLHFNEEMREAFITSCHQGYSIVIIVYLNGNILTSKKIQILTRRNQMYL